jgi:ribonuclease D
LDVNRGAVIRWYPDVAHLAALYREMEERLRAIGRWKEGHQASGAWTIDGRRFMPTKRSAEMQNLNSSFQAQS